MKAKVILPKGLVFNAPKLARAVENGLEGAANDVKVDFDTTTQTFSTRPAFTIERTSGERTVSTDDAIYGYLDEGTPAHPIVAHTPRGLTFAAGGSPKTAPRVIGSKRGSRGGTIVHVHAVNHPGTEARDFSGTIAKKWSGGLLASVMQRSIDSEV